MGKLKFSNWQIQYNEWNKNKDNPTREDRLKTWITKGVDKDAIEWAEIFGRYLAQKDEYALNENNQVIKIKKNNEYKEQKLNPLSSSQLRKFFGAIKSLQNQILMDNQLKEDSDLPQQFKKEILMLKPKLAYAVARAKSDFAKIHNFYDVMATCIDSIQTKQHFKNFISLLEATVAYHKVEEESSKEK